MSNDNLMWKDSGEAEQLWKGPIFSIDQVPRINPAGKEQAMIVCRVPNWVTVIPELPGEGEKEFLMVRQYRHGSGRISCEFPAGIVDPGETDLEAAVRSSVRRPDSLPTR